MAYVSPALDLAGTDGVESYISDVTDGILLLADASPDHLRHNKHNCQHHHCRYHNVQHTAKVSWPKYCYGNQAMASDFSLAHRQV
jgi:hypothetical protein